jgi:hypothetical protein
MKKRYPQAAVALGVGARSDNVSAITAPPMEVANHGSSIQAPAKKNVTSELTKMRVAKQAISREKRVTQKW